MRLHAALAAPAVRAGSTLVELVVAVTVLAVGVLALAATATVAVRRLGASAREERALAAASDRMERLVGLPCAAVAPESLPLTAAPAPGVTERARIDVPPGWAAPPRAKRLVDSLAIRLPAGRGERLVRRVLLTGLPCRE